ncbi:alpha/beta hydrolase [Stenotrophomonas sp. SAU14A_NAIMI4_5]|uniref:alpha/beta hydrolase n=1 Tax=Stenotrophomonas sp. SAU14A_NAIMI4_5 TaxID=2072413 RepID=UPI000D53D736|nr:alpha/beta hydrolase [Stenotrophomonas sp. SAU14A_NAIMI4_5]
MQRPTLFLLHSLGASHRKWDAVQRVLGNQFECVALDIPGFGGTSAGSATDIDALVDWFQQEVTARSPTCWFAVGHSMGGKIATLLAARSRNGVQGLAGLAGVVLVAASPPCPEPMQEARRAKMLEWFAGGPPARADAEAFIDANTHRPLQGPAREAAILDVLCTDPIAWRAWLNQGSREHRQEEAAHLHVPALILAGAEDGDLGEDAQRALNAPHYVHATVDIVPDAAHLIPVEQPEWLAHHIAVWALPLAARALPPAFIKLLDAERVAPRMRARLLARHAMPLPLTESALPARRLGVLAALAARLVPGADADDLALRVGHALVNHESDGWRFADLPQDADAWAQALDQLDAAANGFSTLSPAAQQALLEQVQRQSAAAPASAALDPAQWALWFEDARALFARTWMSLPSTWASIGYDGFAVGGKGAYSPGYEHTQAGVIDGWQLPC